MKLFSNSSLYSVVFCFFVSQESFCQTTSSVETLHSDAQTLSASPTAFEEMLVYVYQNDPHLNSERENVRIADEKVSEANAGYRPTLSANAAAGRQREKIADQNWIYGQDISGSITATQPLFSGFSTLEQKRAAEARVMAARARELSIEQTVLFTAISDWLDVSEKQRIMNLNQENFQHMYQYSETTQKRFKAGDATKTDIAQSESRVFQAEARSAIAQADYDSALATYERDIGLPTTSLDFPSLPSELPKTLEEAEHLADHNPQLTQARQEEVATGHDIESAKSSLWPTIYLQAGASEQHSPALGLDRLRDDSVTLNASIPLYQGGGEYSRIREAKLARQKARFDSLDTSRDVVSRARISWHSYQSAKAVIDASQKASDAAGRALGGVQEEQKQGLRTLTEMLDEQSELLNAQITQMQAQKNIRLESYRLMAAVGRLTAEGLHLNTTPYDPAPHYQDVVPRWAGTSPSE